MILLVPSLTSHNDSIHSLFGVTTLDIVRSSTFVTTSLGIPNDAPKYSVPVVGGHSGTTIVPLLSQSEPKVDEKLLNNKEELEKLVNRIQFGGDEVVKAKDGAGSATVGLLRHYSELEGDYLADCIGGFVDVYIAINGLCWIQVSWLGQRVNPQLCKYVTDRDRRLFYRFVDSLIRAKYLGETGVIEDSCASPFASLSTRLLFS